MHRIDFSHILHYDTKNKKSLYYSSSFRLFGVSLLNIILPWIVYLSTDKSLYLFFCFYIVESLTASLVWVFLSRKVVNQFWTKISIIIGTIFMVLYFIGIFLAQKFFIFFWISAILGGFFTAFFRIWFHSDISNSSKQKNFGQKIANLQIITIIFSSIAPIIWWFLLDNYQSWILIWIASLFIMLSIFPLLQSYKKHTTNTEQNNEFWKFITKNLFTKDSLAFASLGYVTMIWKTYWPLILFIVFKNFTKVWWIGWVTALISVIILHIIGKKLNQSKESKIMSFSTKTQSINRLSTSIISILWSLSGFIVYFVDILNTITNNINTTCIRKTFYEKAWEKNNITIFKVVQHELAIHLSRVLYLSIFAIIFLVFPQNENNILIPIVLLVLIIPLQKIIYKKSNQTKAKEN